MVSETVVWKQVQCFWAENQQDAVEKVFYTDSHLTFS